VCNSVILGVAWLRLGFLENDIYPRFSAIILIFLFWTWFPLLNAPAMVDERSVLPVLRKEFASGSFRLSAWFLVNTTVPIIREVLWASVALPIFYFLAGV
jgi:hypothetical protein